MQLEIDARLVKYGSAKKYYRAEYLEYLKSKERKTLFDFSGEALNAILKTEREKLETEGQEMFRKHREERTKGRIPRKKGWFKSIPGWLVFYARCQTDDSYIIGYLIDNLQEYDQNGKNVTYEGMLNLYPVKKQHIKTPFYFGAFISCYKRVFKQGDSYVLRSDVRSMAIDRSAYRYDVRLNKRTPPL